MKTWLIRFILLAALLAAGFWGWYQFFPSPERVIRQRLKELAQAAAIPANEGPLAKMINAQRLADFFSPEVQVTVDVPNHSVHTFAGRDQLLQGAIAARNFVSSLKVEFVDIRLVLGPDKTSAVAELTARAETSSDEFFRVQELKLSLQRIERTWLVTRVETVKTLR